MRPVSIKSGYARLPWNSKLEQCPMDTFSETGIPLATLSKLLRETQSSSGDRSAAPDMTQFTRVLSEYLLSEKVSFSEFAEKILKEFASPQKDLFLLISPEMLQN